MSQKVDYTTFKRAQKSVDRRLFSLRETHKRWGSRTTPTPIAEIGVFDDEIQVIENQLQAMKTRLDNAKVTVRL